jgi:hypothetical protein
MALQVKTRNEKKSWNFRNAFIQCLLIALVSDISNWKYSGTENDTLMVPVGHIPEDIRNHHQPPVICSVSVFRRNPPLMHTVGKNNLCNNQICLSSFCRKPVRLWKNRLKSYGSG